jgi:hypothetical protein
MIADPTSISASGYVGGAIDVDSVCHIHITTATGAARITSVSNDSTWVVASCLEEEEGCVTPTQVILDYRYEDRPAGVYKDTVSVWCTSATNSPLKIPVTMTLTNPDPTVKKILWRKP